MDTTRKLRPRFSAIHEAKKTYERTGERYRDKPALKAFDPSNANTKLKRSFNGAWVIYACPHCDWSFNGRRWQGWPEHNCRKVV